jgi:DNA-binding transcriptional MerR regulator
VSVLRISELAERSGVPSSTLRYYERIGLVEPLARAENGYRLYDEATVDRLAFIGRAKRLGMSLEDVATLIEAWFTGECGPLQDRLREFVTGRIAALARTIAEESAFERQLQRILVRLNDGGAVPERCGPDCGCDTDPLEMAGPDHGLRVLTCSLPGSDARARLLEWHQILAGAIGIERGPERMSATFQPAADTVAELARLCAAETACCPFFTFSLDITATAVVLTVAAPAGGDAMLGWFADAGRPVVSSSTR